MRAESMPRQARCCICGGHRQDPHHPYGRAVDDRSTEVCRKCHDKCHAQELWVEDHEGKWVWSQDKENWHPCRTDSEWENLDTPSYFDDVPETAGEQVFDFIQGLESIEKARNAERYEYFQRIPCILNELCRVYGPRKGRRMLSDMLKTSNSISSATVTRWVQYSTAPYVEGMEHLSIRQIVTAVQIVNFLDRTSPDESIPFEEALHFVLTLGETEARREFGLLVDVPSAYHECPDCGRRHAVREKKGENHEA